MQIKTGDKVQVTVGREKGKTGQVIKVDRVRNRVTVEGVNLIKRHQRPLSDEEKGGIIEREAAIDASNVLLYSEQLGRGVRTSVRFVGAEGAHYLSRKEALATFEQTPSRIEKVRFCAKTGEVF